MRLNNVDVKHIQEGSRTTTKTYEVALTIDHEFSER